MAAILLLADLSLFCQYSGKQTQASTGMATKVRFSLQKRWYSIVYCVLKCEALKARIVPQCFISGYNSRS